MFAWRRSILSIVTVGMLMLATIAGAQTQQTPESLWADFNHYVRIARPDMALAAGTALLNAVDNDQQLLDVVEANREYADWQAGTISRARNIDTLEDLANDLAIRIQKARVDRSRDVDRIKADIAILNGSRRERLAAIERLKSARQFAAEHLLATLLDEKQANLHPYVLTTMVAIGQPVVYPLSVALPDLEPVPQSQVAQVLGEIGYPMALPYLKQVAENSNTETSARRIVGVAYQLIAEANNIPEGVTAAELYLQMAQNYYGAQTAGREIVGYDAANEVGILWRYSDNVGLVPQQIPVEVFGDVLAMKSSETALKLNSQLDPALSLWLMANLRRENNLPAGVPDPSYPSDGLPAEFYARMAGPTRLHDVLARALQDGDATLALDAIFGLASTAGTEALVNSKGTSQPLLDALNFPDRRVRFEAAFVFTNARPKAAFPGSFRVVPVLSEALRQTDTRYAVVLGRSTEEINTLSAIIRDLGYETYSGMTLTDVADQIAGGPGVDLVVVRKDLEGVQKVFAETRGNYKLAAVPVLAAVDATTLIELEAQYQDERRLVPGATGVDPAEFNELVNKASSMYVGKPVDAAEALNYATTALRLLHDIALSSADVFNVVDAKPALLQAMDDPRAEVPPLAGAVLALLDDETSQRAIADAALDTTRTTDARIAQLRNLATSAMRYGNKLQDLQLAKLLALVKASTGELAIAAAEAHGALTQPTGNVVELITSFK
jgi:hypothetical protein